MELDRKKVNCMLTFRTHLATQVGMNRVKKKTKHIYTENSFIVEFSSLLSELLTLCFVDLLTKLFSKTIDKQNPVMVQSCDHCNFSSSSIVLCVYGAGTPLPLQNYYYHNKNQFLSRLISFYKLYRRACESYKQVVGYALRTTLTIQE